MGKESVDLMASALPAWSRSQRKEYATAAAVFGRTAGRITGWRWCSLRRLISTVALCCFGWERSAIYKKKGVCGGGGHQHNDQNQGGGPHLRHSPENLEQKKRKIKGKKKEDWFGISLCNGISGCLYKALVNMFVMTDGWPFPMDGEEAFLSGSLSWT